MASRISGVSHSGLSGYLILFLFSQREKEREGIPVRNVYETDHAAESCGMRENPATSQQQTTRVVAHTASLRLRDTEYTTFPGENRKTTPHTSCKYHFQDLLEYF